MNNRPVFHITVFLFFLAILQNSLVAQELAPAQSLARQIVGFVARPLAQTPNFIRTGIIGLKEIATDAMPTSFLGKCAAAYMILGTTAAAYCYRDYRDTFEGRAIQSLLRTIKRPLPATLLATLATTAGYAYKTGDRSTALKVTAGVGYLAVNYMALSAARLVFRRFGHEEDDGRPPAAQAA